MTGLILFWAWVAFASVAIAASVVGAFVVSAPARRETHLDVEVTR